jgi:hypothetical protein
MDFYSPGIRGRMRRAGGESDSGGEFEKAGIMSDDDVMGLVREVRAEIEGGTPPVKSWDCLRIDLNSGLIYCFEG